MREYGKVYSSFWQSPEVRAMTEDARTLALYLLTTPHGSLIGAFRMPDAYAAEDLQWGSERVAEGFRNLSESLFLSRDDATKWLILPKFLKWNQFDNPNVAKAAHRAFELVPDGLIKQRLARAILDHGQHLSEPFRKDCETLCQQSRNKGAGAGAGALPEPNRSKRKSRTGILAPGSATPDAAEAPASDAKPTKAAWDGYRSAYLERYGCEPVRNAKVNGQLAQLVARLGADEAPAVSRFYVGHQRQDYVRAMHPVDFLLRDAESLRTSWATGRQVTNAQATLTDRTQTNLLAFSELIAEAKAKEAVNG
jgi:hypothetical protein